MCVSSSQHRIATICYSLIVSVGDIRSLGFLNDLKHLEPRTNQRLHDSSANLRHSFRNRDCLYIQPSFTTSSRCIRLLLFHLESL